MIASSHKRRIAGLILGVMSITSCTTALPLPSSTQPSVSLAGDAGLNIAATPHDLQASPTILVPTVTSVPEPTIQATATVKSTALPNDYGEAPEIDTDVWLNTEQPLRLADLRGQVVLVDFWTYG